MRISDWSSDVCSSDLIECLSRRRRLIVADLPGHGQSALPETPDHEGIRSEERRVGKSVSVRVDLGGRRIIKKKNTKELNQQYESKCIINNSNTKTSIHHYYSTPLITYMRQRQ